MVFDRSVLADCKGVFTALTLACFAITLPHSGAHAQVVQPLPDPASAQLNDALRRLSRDPESFPALIAAGQASIELDDADAASGFFTRAQAIQPNSGRVLLGLALVALRRENAVESLELFDRASAAGENLRNFAADRGLAHDLVGENTRAQQLYGESLSRGENVEVIRRLALSYAIGGDQAASEAILLPLLQRRDLAAYRTRAFALAILGREEEAVSIAETMLPARLARRMGPYLRNMQRLTPSQQAAAANLGSFPAAVQIGRDEPQLARRVPRSGVDAPAISSPSAAVPASNVDERLIPGGPALGNAEQAPPQVVIAEMPEPEPVAPPPPEIVEAPAEPEPAAEPPAPVVVAVLEEPEAPVPAPEPAPTPEPDLDPVETSDPVPAARPSFSISEPEVAEPEPETAPEPEPEPETPTVSLSEAFADFSLPAGSNPVTAAPGAVDITAIEPAREQREPEPPPPPAHPSRHWVQVATGQNIAAFRFDWRRIVRSADGALADQSAYRARWNQTNRLVTGPFETTRAAQAMVTALEEAGVDAFRFSSAEGEEVVPLD